ncbi:DUF1684 domain-containing protein [Pseudarthrobacter sp. P1]|uniref:DUF1684 domain-containing protein n=1 Tax=Pseudarthrobacter sp. P1 TaxID=3418418 RepID=UPI003CF1C96C
MAIEDFDATDDVAGAISAVDIADWRLRTFALYDIVRTMAATDPAEAHAWWQRERLRMFLTHPASALTEEMKADFAGLRTAPYDPGFRKYAPLSPHGAGEELNVQTGTDGIVPFVRLGTLNVPDLGTLALWRLCSYGGGLFLPFRDATAGKPGGSYGAGRYLLDTNKGAFHGVRETPAGQEFVLDFNFAYNPSCAYNEAWACPLPGPANRLEVEVPVGELYAPA